MAPIANSLGYQYILTEESNDNLNSEQKESLEVLNQKLKPKLNTLNIAQITILLVQLFLIRRSIGIKKRNKQTEYNKRL